MDTISKVRINHTMKRSLNSLSKKWPVVMALFTFLFSSVAIAEALSSNIVGSAYSLKTGALLYRETHQPLSDKTYRVEYSEPNGTVFGYKTIDLSESAITPSFSQVNDRNGERIDVMQTNNTLQIAYQENSATEAKKDSVKLVAGMIVDAGFDAFIKQYWDALEAGNQMDIEYLVPSKQTTFTFRFSQASCVQGTQKGAECFSLIPVSWFVKLAVDPIIVAYEPVQKRLLRFTGRANICDSQGKYQSVDIQYRYL
jgi:hypothetical protein